MKRMAFALFALVVALPLIAEDAEFYYEWGIKYFEAREVDLAIWDFTEAIRRNPNNANIWNSRGNAYLYYGKLDLAIEDFSKALALDPDNIDAFNIRGIIYRIMGELDLAIEDFSKALALDPNNIDALNNRSMAYRNKGESDLADEDNKKAIALNPNNEYWVSRERSMAIITSPMDFSLYRDYTENDLNKAIKKSSKEIELNHHNADAWYSRGEAYRVKGELGRAIDDYTQAIDLNPNFAYAYNSRGIAFRDNNQLEQAIKDHSRAIDLDPYFTTAFNSRGIAYQAKGDLNLAIRDYTKAITLDANYVQALNNRGIARRAKGELNLAIEDFTKAITIDSQSSQAWNNLGIAYYDKGEYDSAIDNYNVAIDIDPKNVLAWNNRAHAYIKKGELSNAISDLRRSIKAADRSINLMDIFLLSWELTGDFHNFDHLFNKGETANDPGILGILYIDLVRDSLNRSISRAENVRSTLGFRGVDIMTSFIYQYYAGVNLEASFGSPEKAYNYSEGLRSRGFLEQIGTKAALNLPEIEEIEAGRIEILINDIDNIRRSLASLDPQIEAGKYAKAALALTMAENALSSLDAQISEWFPRYGELRNPKPSNLAEAQEWCGETRVILEYVIWDPTIVFNPPVSAGALTTYQNRSSINSYCLVITKADIIPVRLDKDFDYAGKVNDLRSKLYYVAGDKIYPSQEDTFEAERNELYNALIKPVLQYIPPGIKELVIVPDGNLGHLPFDILRKNETCPVLGETYSISLSPSISVSKLAAKAGEPQYLPIMAFGGAWYDERKTVADREQSTMSFSGNGSNSDQYLPDLPWTEKEVKNMEKLVLFPEDIQVFLGSDVSEAHIKSLSKQGELIKYPILHFACHGYFDEKDAERSAIVLSEVSGLLDTGEDGYLRIPEIVLLNMDSSMVMLSACSTGLGTLKRGDGMVGMARAFMVSSVEKVGVSLWPISDKATVEFMTRLYDKVLNEGKTFKEAYYLVKNEFRQDPRGNYPYYWAAFVMYE